MQNKKPDMIVGNYESRQKLKKNVLNIVPTFLVGPNGIGKTSVVKEIADFTEMIIKKIIPLNQEEIVKEFGVGPSDASNNYLYVVEADGLNARKYSILKNYVNNLKRPLIIIAQNKEKLNKTLVKLLDVIEFTHPSFEDVEKLLITRFDWNGKIEDIYDPDMRIVLSRVLTGERIDKPSEERIITAQDLAVDLGFGYVKKEDFERLEQPLWWVIRWLAYNQKFKFPKTPRTLLDNLKKLSLIDEYKFMGVEDCLHYMLMGLKGSPRRAFFKFPIWPKKEKEIESFESISKMPEKPIKEKFDLTRWI